ncbi:restriction endonuclease subunit S [Candidatus Poribacteria bacterium]|nr:MAG: restriction endonuclease subunit S [Candidatus Poribacteria bacterium]
MDANKIREIRLIRENPRFRHYPEYKESGVEWIGEIPTHWNLAMLKYTARLVYGDTLVSENRENGVVPVYGSNGIIDTHSSANTLSPAIIVGRKGSLGKIQYSDVPCFVIDTAYYIDRRTSHVNLRWLHYIFQALKLERFRNSVLPGLNRESAEGQYVPLITAEEQTQIAKFLDRKTGQIDELIRVKERRIELLQEQRTALINQAVTKGLDPSVEMKPSGVEWIGEIPAHWEMRRNKRIFNERDDRSATGEEELLTVSHITGVSPRAEKKNVGMFLAETLEGYKHCSVGNLVINTMWAWMGALGISTFDGIVSPSYNVYQLNSSEYLPKYYDYLYRTPNHVKEIIRWSKGIWNSRWRLYPDAFFSMSAIVPPFGEQKQIVDFLEHKNNQIDDLIAAEQRKIELLKEYRQSLISEAVTGKIDVRNEV